MPRRASIITALSPKYVGIVSGLRGTMLPPVMCWVARNVTFSGPRGSISTMFSK